METRRHQLTRQASDQKYAEAAKAQYGSRQELALLLLTTNLLQVLKQFLKTKS